MHQDKLISQLDSVAIRSTVKDNFSSLTQEQRATPDRLWTQFSETRWCITAHHWMATHVESTFALMGSLGLLAVCSPGSEEILLALFECYRQKTMFSMGSFLDGHVKYSISGGFGYNSIWHFKLLDCNNRDIKK